MWLKYLSGPVIGAVIGYCTNYIAVKMLFYPRKEIRIFGHRLPFTPGAIPKGKPRLAKAIGNIVGKSLVTKEDMVKAEDMGNYFRVPADNRDLNYDKYVNQGNKNFEIASEYNSHNTERLDIEGMKKLLLKLDLFK